MKKNITLFMILVLIFTLSSCGAKDSIASNCSDTLLTTTSSSLTNLQTVKAGSDDLVAMASYATTYGIKYGYINTQGQWVIAPQYAGGTTFSDGVAVVYTEEAPKRPLVIDKTGAVIAEFSVDIELAEKYGGGSSSYACAGENYGKGIFISEGMFCITDDSGLFGYANIKGEVVVPPKYDFVNDFSEGLALVGYYGSDKSNLSYIDTTGKTVIEGPFTEAHGFHEGLAYVHWLNSDDSLPGGESGYIDKSGNIVIRGHGKRDCSNITWIWEGPIDVATDFYNGFAFTEYSIAGVADDGFSDNKKVTAVIDKSGNLIWTSGEREYVLERTLRKIDNGLFFATGHNCLNIIDINGTVTPTEYNYIHQPFSEGLCIVTSHNGSGSYQYINENGETAISKSYAYAYSFINGFACVSEGIDGEYEYIDKTGNVAVTGDFINLAMPFTK